MIWDDMGAEFELFCDTAVHTGELLPGSYGQRPQFVAGEEFVADVQPYSSRLLHKEYGLEGESGLRLFSSSAPLLCVGDCLLIGSTLWRIREFFGWRSGVCAILEEAKEYDCYGGQ